MGRPKEDNKQITILVKETTDAVLTTISKQHGKSKGKIVDDLMARYIVDERYYKSFMDRLDLEQNDPTHREVSDKLTNLAMKSWCLECTKIKWIKASEQLPPKDEEILMCYLSEVCVATYDGMKFCISDDLEFTSDGRLSCDIDNEHEPVEIKWVRMTDVLQFIVD